MSRTRLAGAAVLFLAFLPGCGILTGDRRTLCERWRDCRNGGQVEACPVSYPVVDSGCGNGCAMPIPGGLPYGQPPIYMGGPATSGPGVSGPFGSETLPNPGGVQTMPPRIPKAGIDEGKGKQFELEGASRPGRTVGPALPVGTIK